jgi:putative ABC transport system permease protein
MSPWRQLVRGFRVLTNRSLADQDVIDEVQHYLEQTTAAYIERGYSPDDARRAARLELGGVTNVREQVRGYGWENVVDTTLADLRYAVRRLRAAPAFTAVIILTLGVAIGANSAIFSVVDGVLLRPLPYPNADRLLMVWESDRNSGTTREDASVPDYYDLRNGNRSFAAVGAFEEQPLTLTQTGAEPVRLVAGTVSRNLLQILGVAPQLGRGFTDAEDTPGGARVAMLGEQIWRTRFGGDPKVIGRVIRLDDEPYTVVGVLPASVAFPSEHTDLWVPLQQGPTTTPRYNHIVKVIGRLRPGVTLEAAQVDVREIAQHVEAVYPENKARGMTVEPLPTVLFAAVRPSLLVLLGAVGLVLLVACANVANLLLARAMVRQREVAVRTALGATAGRLARQFFTESLLLTLAAAGVGLVLSALGLRLLLAMAPADLPRTGNVGINATVLGFTFAVAIAVSFGFGLVPTFSALKLNLQNALRTGGRNSSADLYHRRLRETLVVAEIALAVVLVVGAGLLVRSFWTLRQVDPGFTAQNVLHASLELPAARYPQSYDNYPHWTQITGFYEQVTNRVATIPGVRSVAFASNGPLDPGITNSFIIEGREAEAERGQAEISTRLVSPGYFVTIGLPLLKGRLLTNSDNADAPTVAVINATAARQYFPNQNPIGHRLKFWGQWREIVGIVGDEHFHGLTEAAPAAVYTPLQQTPIASVTLLARTTGDPSLVIGAVRSAVENVGGEVALFDVGTMQQALSGSIARQRFTMLLLGVFASVATALALLGIYGVLSYTVAQRYGEMGIRMALGAAHGDIVRLIFRRGAVLVLAGLGIGLAAALAGSRVLAHLLFSIGTTDAATYAMASVVIAAAALGASYLPARRAAGIDPAVALRREY